MMIIIRNFFNKLINFIVIDENLVHTTKKMSFSDGFGTEFKEDSHGIRMEMCFRTDFKRIGRWPKKLRRKS